MALQKQIVQFPLFAGIDTKTDDKVRPIGKLNKAQNVVFDKTLKLRKRNGYDEVITEYLDNTAISDPRNLAKFNNELLLMNETSLNAYSDSLGKFIRKGNVHNVIPTSTPIIRNIYQQSSPDSLVVENIKIVTWMDTQGGSKYSVIDRSSGTFLVSEATISATAKCPRIGAIQNQVYIYYAEGVNLKYVKFSILSPSTLSSPVTVATDVNVAFPFLDTVSIDERVYVTYVSSNANQVGVFFIDSGDVLSAITFIIGSLGDFGLCIFADSQSKIFVAHGSASLVVSIFFNSLGSPITNIGIEAIANATSIAITETGTNTYKVYWEIQASPNTNRYIKQRPFNLSGTTGAATVFLRGCSLATKSFNVNGNNYLGIVFPSSIQATYFIVNESGITVSKISNGTAGSTLTSFGSLPKVNTIDDKTVFFTSQIKGQLVADNGTFYSLLGINGTELDFTLNEIHETGFQNNNLHISGGVLQLYDGLTVTEHGFNYFPEAPTAGSTGTTTGFMSNGTYEYVAVYSWTDNYGQIHRSAPSPSVSVTLSGGTSTQFQNIVIPTLRLTEKQNVIIELYRTENNGTIFYKIQQLYGSGNLGINDKTVDTITIKDGGSDANLITNEVLYTTGGVLENIAAPSAKIVSEFKNRIVLAGLEDPNMLQFSKEKEEGKPIEFNDILTRQVKSTNGPITAIEELNEKMIIFKEGAIFYMAGNGPNNLGEQDDFTDVELVTSDIGCIDRDSVVQTPSGILFKSKKGIYLLDSSMGVNYIGADVEEYNNLDITSAKIVPELNQIRFTTSDGPCLVYNYYVGFWSTFTNHEARSAEIVGDYYYYLRKDGTLYKSNDTSYSDNGSPIKMLIETSWISFSNLQGMQRVYKLLLLGNYKSDHDIQIKVAYDFQDAYIQSKTINPESFLDVTTYGSESPYGTGTYGGSDMVYQFRLDMKKQKCQSIKLKIEDIQGDVGEGLNLVGLTFEVGAKEGVFKMSQSKTFGTSTSNS